MQDIGEARQFLSFLNGRTAFLVAVVMFNFGISGILGEYTYMREPSVLFPWYFSWYNVTKAKLSL